MIGSDWWKMPVLAWNICRQGPVRILEAYNLVYYVSRLKHFTLDHRNGRRITFPGSWLVQFDNSAERNFQNSDWKTIEWMVGCRFY